MKREKPENSAEQALPGDGKSEELALPGDGKLHPPPSMLWFVIPFGLLLIYALLTR